MCLLSRTYLCSQVWYKRVFSRHHDSVCFRGNAVNKRRDKHSMYGVVVTEDTEQRTPPFEMDATRHSDGARRLAQEDTSDGDAAIGNAWWLQLYNGVVSMELENGKPTSVR